MHLIAPWYQSKKQASSEAVYYNSMILTIQAKLKFPLIIVIH